MTNSRGDKELQKAMHDTACEWIVRLRAEDVSQADRQDFALWLAANPAHRAAMDDMLDLWEDLEVLVHLEQSGAMRPGAKATGTDSPTPHPQRGQRRWLAAGIALAASVLLALLLSPALQLDQSTQAYETRLGEQLSVKLEDGSRLQLNTNTALRVSFEHDLRSVTLDRGEAYFEVARNSARPFVVLAGNTEVRVLGTAFSVKLRGEESEVTVTDGVVRVAERDAPATRPAQSELLYHDQQIRAGVNGLSATNKVVSDDLLAWRDGKLVAEEMPLATLVDELSRYHPTRIFIAEPGLAGITVSGVFRLQDLDNILLALEHTVDVRSVTLDDGSIQLTQAPL